MDRIISPARPAPQVRQQPTSGTEPQPLPRSPQSRQRFVLLLGLALLVGFALRLGISLTDDAPSTDETAYLRSGESLVAGEGFERDGKPELHFPPFVPFLLGTVSRVVSDPHSATVIVTLICSTAVIIPLALLARRIAGWRAGITTAWVAAVGPALSTTLVRYGAGSEGIYVLLVVLALWFVVAAIDATTQRARMTNLVLAGASVGVAYLTRPEGLFLLAPLGAAVVLAMRRQRWKMDRRDAVRLGTGFLAPVVVCVVPYVMFLHDHTGSWQLSAKTQDVSIEAWQAVAANDRQGRDEELWSLDESRLRVADREHESLAALAREDPAGYAQILGTNVARLTKEIVNPARDQPTAWLLLPAPLWALAGYAVWRNWQQRIVKLVCAVAALPVATVVIFFVQPRYLLLLVALATVLVGVGLATLSDRARRYTLAGAMVLLAASTIQGFRGPAGWWHPTEHAEQQLAGEWIAAHTRPGDRILARSMVVEYYADRYTMAIPYADMDAVLNYARFHGAQYLIIDSYTVERLRPQLAALQTVDLLAGLQLVHEVEAEGRTARIFAFVPSPPQNSPAGASLGFMGDGSA